MAIHLILAEASRNVTCSTGDRGVEMALPELDREVPRVILDRGDVIDGFSKPPAFGIDKPVERLLLDIDEVGDVKDLVQPRKAAAGAGSVNRSQDGDSSGVARRTRERALGRARQSSHKARPSKIAQGVPDPCEGRSALTDPVRPGVPYVAEGALWTATTIGRVRTV